MFNVSPRSLEGGEERSRAKQSMACPSGSRVPAGPLINLVIFPQEKLAIGKLAANKTLVTTICLRNSPIFVLLST